MANIERAYYLPSTVQSVHTHTHHIYIYIHTYANTHTRLVLTSLGVVVL